MTGQWRRPARGLAQYRSRGFSHLSFRYPLDQGFDWRGDIAFSPEGEYHGRAEQLIKEIENETGIGAEDDRLVATMQKDGTTP